MPVAFIGKEIYIPAKKGSFLLTRFKDIIYAFRMEHPFALKSNNDTAETLIRWEAPPARWALLNTNGAAKGNPRVAGGNTTG